MSRTARIVVAIVAFGLVVSLAILAYVWFTGGSGTPSEAISAATLDRAATDEATQESENAATEEAPELTIFNIVPDESEVRFIITEELRGSPNTVTGRTDQIAGQIGVSFDDPRASQVGEIRINARTLATDNEFRNRAIRGQILQSAQDEFEFINFEPTLVEGLPSAVTMGGEIEFQVTGDMTIRDITQPVTFNVILTPFSQSRLEGTATATVQRSDFGLEIPNVPGVANVAQEVNLEIDFVATAE
jgi:polyisoprenoid-binding protein YceI